MHIENGGKKYSQENVYTHCCVDMHTRSTHTQCAHTINLSLTKTVRRCVYYNVAYNIRFVCTIYASCLGCNILRRKYTLFLTSMCCAVLWIWLRFCLKWNVSYRFATHTHAHQDRACSSLHGSTMLRIEMRPNAVVVANVCNYTLQCFVRLLYVMLCCYCLLPLCCCCNIGVEYNEEHS